MGILGALALLAACAHEPKSAHSGHEMSKMAADKMAVASLGPGASGGPSGMVMFHAMDGHLMVHVRMSGLTPGRKHGFHVHANGSCASADFLSAGGHFNPGGQAHGGPTQPHHAGDMPNLEADAQGQASQKFMLHGVSLKGAQGIVGKAVIVHADPDDYATQPTGNSGARIACGVIAAH
jgi:Cu-Zn family superoxide dismutase